MEGTGRVEDQILRQVVSSLLAEDSDALAQLVSQFPEQTKKVLEQELAREGLAGFGYIKLRSLANKIPMPAETLTTLEQLYISQWATNKRRLPELKKILDVLTAAKLETIVLKGAPFEQRYFKDIGQKSWGDIDILVHGKSQLEQADTILQTHGYTRTSITLFSKSFSANFFHALNYRKENLWIDLHWTIRPHFSWSLDDSRIWGDNQEVNVEGISCRALSDEYTLLTLLLSIFTDIPVGYLRLKTYIDCHAVMVLIENADGWETFFTNRAKEHLLPITVNTLDLVSTYLGLQSSLPRLSRQLDKHSNLVLFKTSEEKCKVLLRSPHRIARKVQTLRYRIWALRLYDANLLRCIAWDVFAKPVRILLQNDWVSNIARFPSRVLKKIHR